MHKSLIWIVLILLTSPVFCFAQEANFRSRFDRLTNEAEHAISSGNYERMETIDGELEYLFTEMKNVREAALSQPLPNPNAISTRNPGPFDTSWVFVVFAAALSLVLASLLPKTKR